MLNIETSAAAPKSARWYVAKTQPRKEIVARLNLANQGFTAFLPRAALALGKKAKTPASAAFFPGYLFVRFDLGRDRWQAINSTLGVSHLLKFGAAPTPVPVGVVETLSAHAGPDEVLRHLPPPEMEPLVCGDPVRVRAGSFEGLVGELLSIDGEGRVEVLIELMQRSVRVSLSRSAVTCTA